MAEAPLMACARLTTCPPLAQRRGARRLGTDRPCHRPGAKRGNVVDEAAAARARQVITHRRRETGRESGDKSNDAFRDQNNGNHHQDERHKLLAIRDQPDSPTLVDLGGLFSTEHQQQQGGSDSG